MRTRPLVVMALLLAFCVGSAGAQGARPIVRPTLSMLTGASEVVSERDGTATVSFTIGGYGSGTCKAYLYAFVPYTYVHVNAKFEISPGSAFPKVVALKVPRPGVYWVRADKQDFAEEGCQGKASFQVDLKVKPHPDFPCSLYPGFKKDFLGAMWFCKPPTPSVKVEPFGYLCEGGMKFVNVLGLVFGCVPPGTFY